MEEHCSADVQLTITFRVSWGIELTWLGDTEGENKADGGVEFDGDESGDD